MGNPSQLRRAHDQLVDYGIIMASGSQPKGWPFFLQMLLVGPVPITEPVGQLLNSPAFSCPEALLALSTGQLVELLTEVPRGGQKAGLLRAVAAWWQQEFGEEIVPEWTRELDDYRESLRRIRGLGPATVDELLMFVAELPVFPLDRGTVRVAIRHGWLDLPLEDMESQSFFVQGLATAEIDPRQFAMQISQVAKAYCGREPDCENCPLKPLLPPQGPLNPDSV